MREIIYIQAGNISNHIATHFWNTQESYFDFSSDGDSRDTPLVDHDISFREGLSSQNEQTFCPRVLLFDHKSNFGPLGKHNDLYSDTPVADQSLSGGLWNGPVTEHRQDQIAKSKYQKFLEYGEEEDNDGSSDSAKLSETRFWSDYNRLFYIPRSIQQVPDLPDWEASKGNWNYGKSIFERFDSNNLLIEESLRQFVEESDNFQGFQTSFDNSSFGGFIAAFLESIRGEFPKIPVLALPVLSGVDPARIGVEDVALRKVALQDAACLHALNELATQNVPIQAPTSWQLGSWSEHLDINKDNLYHTSAVLSSLVESATLPFRLKDRNEGLSDLCHQLNWAQTTGFSHLSGVLPFVDSDNIGRRVYDFSASVDLNNKRVGQFLAQRNVTRGLSISQVLNLEGFFLSNSGLETPYLSSIYAPAYPLPSSYPSIFRSFSPNANSQPTIVHPNSQTSAALLSTLSTTTATASMFRAYAALTRECLRRRVAAPAAAGLEPDELQELEEALWTMCDGYAGMGGYVEEGDEAEGEIGEDEDEEWEL